jgi:voltage-gated potassium channel
MICAYGIIAVPTGIVSAEMVKASGEAKERKICPGCKAAYHEKDAQFCRYCGGEL